MVDKIFKILEAVAKTKGINSVSIIQNQTDMPRSTVHRLLQNMEKAGMIVYVQDKGYAISQKMQYMCLSSNENTTVLEVMVPLVKEIAAKTKETVSVNVVNDMERLCIYRVWGTKHAISNVKLGETGPLFKGSTGCVLAAYLSESRFEEAVRYGEENGIITEGNKEDLLKKTEKCRQDGYAVSIEERYSGCWSVAVPVVSGITHEFIGAISVNSVLSSYSEEVKEQYIRMLQEAAAKASFKILR